MVVRPISNDNENEIYEV